MDTFLLTTRDRIWRLTIGLFVLLAVVLIGAVGPSASLPVGAATADPVVLLPSDFVLSSPAVDGVAFSPSVGRFLTAWVGEDSTDDGGLEVRGRLLGPDGSVWGDVFRISWSGPEGAEGFVPYDVTVTFSPRRVEFVVAWASTSDGVDDEAEIYAQRVGTDGTLLGDRTPITTTAPRGPTAYPNAEPRLAYNAGSDEFLVVWQGNDDAPDASPWRAEVFGQRVSGALKLIGSRLQISSTEFNGGFGYRLPTVAHNPLAGEYLVAWQAGASEFSGSEIHAQRLSADGSLLGDAIQVSFMDPGDEWRYNGLHPSLVFGPSTGEYLVVWRGNDSGDGSADEGEGGCIGFEIYGQRVNSEGALKGERIRMTAMGEPNTLTSEAYFPSISYIAETGGFVLTWTGVDHACGGIHPIPDCEDDEPESYARLLGPLGAVAGPQTLIPEMGDVARLVAASVEPFAGYLMLESDGTTHGFGDAVALEGSTPASGVAVDVAITPTQMGSWLLDEDGRVHESGDAQEIADVDMSVLDPGERLTAIAATPTGAGYWVFTGRGRAIAFGDAPNFGGVSHLNLDGAVIDSAATVSGVGYYMLGSDGGVFSFGDAAFYGSIPQILPGVTLDGPIVGIVPTPGGLGYWLVASDGGVFSFGDAEFRGSIPQVLPGVTLVAPVNGMVSFGAGYLMVAADGGVFNFSDHVFYGSLGDIETTYPIVAIAPIDRD